MPTARLPGGKHTSIESGRSARSRDPHDWSDALALPLFVRLSEEERVRLVAVAAQFIRRVQFTSVDIDLTDRMRRVIAAQAALPVLNLGLSWYRGWKTIVVVPREFRRNVTDVDDAGVVHEYIDPSVGESWDDGPVLLSWDDVRSSGHGDGYNVVIHEAAHRIDLTDGDVNGRPALPKGMSAGLWYDTCRAAFADLSRPARRRRSRIDPYAVTDDAEFFAVTSEVFFERPSVLNREYPDLYRLYAQFYRQDPLG